MCKTIRNYRLLRGYSQSYMAFCLDLSQNSYSRIELGRIELTVKRLIEISDILEISPSILLESALKDIRQQHKK
nr:helix-turn-helix transcriptional regulator [Pedobacter xinjiangensis]